MTILIVGLIMFHTVHVVPMNPALRNGLVERFGEGAYKGIFSLVSLIGLGLIIWGKSSTGFIELYDPPNWGKAATMILVLLAFIFLAAFHTKSYIRARLKHPMLIAIILWSLGHLLANGDVASVLLFGSFLLYSVVDLMVCSVRGTKVSIEPKIAHDAIAVFAGILVYAVVLSLHGILFGVWILN